MKDKKMKKTNKERMLEMYLAAAPHFEGAPVHQKAETGKVYLYKNTYYAIADLKEPYEAYVCSPFWELATDKDLITEVNGEWWALEGIVRYVTQEVLNKSVEIGEINPADLEAMKAFIHENHPLPSDRTGLVPGGKNDPRWKFRQEELRRSLILTAEALNKIFEEEEAAEDKATVIELNIAHSQVEQSIRSDLKAAAASFEDYIQTDFGELIKQNGLFVLMVDDAFVDKPCTINIAGETVYHGYLPEVIKIKTTLNNLETFLSHLQIECD